MRNYLVLTLGVAAALFALSANAAKGFIDTKKVKPDQLGQVADIVHEEMQPDGRFGNVTDEERAEVTALLLQMQQIVDGKHSLKELSEDDRVALINAQESANEILAKWDEDKQICERRQVVGSHRTETFCESAWDKKRRNQYSNDVARESDRRARVCVDSATACKGAGYAP